MIALRVALTQALVAVLCAGTALAAMDAAGPAPDCGVPTTARASDPVCGEQLDGRAAPPTGGPVEVPRAVLWVPRMTARALFWPVLEGMEVIEANHIQNWMEDLLTSDDGLVGVRPVLTYATGFLPCAGLRFFYRRLPGAGSGLAAHFQTAGPSILLGELSAAGPFWTGLSLRLTANRRDDRLFAGIGPQSDAALAAAGYAQARFASDIFAADARWVRPLPAHFQLAVHGDAQRRDYRASGVSGGPSISEVFRATSPDCAPGAPASNACVDPALVPGFRDGLRIVHGGTSLAWNHRDRSRYGSGLDLSVDTTFGQGVGSDPSEHLTTSGEMTAALGGSDRVLLLRGRAAAVRRLGEAEVPFEELVSPSGNAGMRGFPEGRFRGQSGVVGTAEYRWYVSHDLDASLFSDLGTVAGPGFAGLGQSRWFPSFGFALRLYSTPDVYWEGSLDTGLEIVYAPDGGVRFLLAVAAF